MPQPLVEVKGVRKKYGRQIVLDDISFLITENQKIALVGRNGAGKSTIMKILTNEEEADGGEVNFFDKTRIGVIDQHEVLPKDQSVLDYLVEISQRPEWEVKKMASHFDLTEAYLQKGCQDLSGGYQMRVKIARMLLAEPNLLLLDEPVNYLDLSTLILLERFLQLYRGSFILIAHDREFLERTCLETYEIEQGQLVTYKGTVSEYYKWKYQQRDLAKKHNKKLTKQIKHHQKFVDRFRYKAKLASRAQSKIKHISKLRRRLVQIDTELAQTRIDIPSPHITNGLALQVDDLTIGYKEKVIAKGINFDIMRGDKVLICGNNGQGKSTLLKTVLNKIEPLSGSFKWWHGVDIGYYDQMTHRELNDSETVLDYLMRRAPKEAAGEQILAMAGNFLFKNDDLEKKIGVLSGGERARLCLAGILLHRHNVLILDEPSNHLDVETSEALAMALSDYSGTILFVSHARTFVNTLVEKIFEVSDGEVHQYMDSYEAYVEDLEDRVSFAEDIEEVKKGIGKEVQLQIKRKQREQERIQKKIDELEVEKSKILKYFFENPMDYAPEKAQRQKEIEDLLIEMEANWLNFQAEIDHLR